ncbi:sensor histidine kinase [Neobacillus endophyticus]|uniref:sensor histidine kinase n=1 Tax=Neobacillus endophyticus TaxID=2738405 RepID=UPI001FE9C997|nr:HAMP domain-containing sensor histidine kinase [Neobacillus endophyticus]
MFLLWIMNPMKAPGIILLFLPIAYLSLKIGSFYVQKHQRDNSLKTITSGTALLNHTIKNELAKIDILMNQLKDLTPLNDAAAENIDLALNSTHHVLELSSRIQGQLDVINLKETEFLLRDCIDSAIRLLQPYLQLKICKQYEVNVKIRGDSLHLQESFQNILKNAMEATDRNGKITIKIYKTRRKVFIEIEDNGKGMKKKELLHVFNPFYSTKETKSNYGLGLTYCYKVLQKHNGAIAITSKVNQGTTCTLSLPSKRITEVLY